MAGIMARLENAEAVAAAHAGLIRSVTDLAAAIDRWERGLISDAELDALHWDPSFRAAWTCTHSQGAMDCPHGQKSCGPDCPDYEKDVLPGPD